ncbi:transcriptional regulator [bacterium]|nr:transcriptional regulator [bacterium]
MPERNAHNDGTQRSDAAGSKAHKSKADIELDEIVHAPARLLIMATLSVVNSADFNFLLKQTELTRGNLSSHLSRLEQAGYVEIRKEFVEKIPRTLIRLSDKGFAAFEQYRRNMTQMLDK